MFILLCIFGYDMTSVFLHAMDDFLDYVSVQSFSEIMAGVQES